MAPEVVGPPIVLFEDPENGRAQDGPQRHPQSVAMKISRHKAASMFRRYDVANEDDLRGGRSAI
jgi:hypothetical protein